MNGRALTALAAAFAVAGAALLAWPRLSAPAQAPNVVVASVSSSPSDSIAAPTRPAPTASTTPPPSTPKPKPTTSTAPRTGDDVEIPTPTSAPTGEEAKVLAAARSIAKAYARPPASVTQQQWWARLQPLLSAQARSDYMYVQGRKVPFTRVIAEPLLETSAQGEDAHLSATVLVPTDAGTYELQLITVDGSTWRATRITSLEDPE